MTVSSSTAKAGPYAGAGLAGPFTIPFRFLAASHLQVIKTSTAGIDTVLTLTTDYSVSGVGASSGSLTLTAPLAAGERLTIVRNVPFTQLADYVNNDAFPAESHEDALDLLTMQTQQLKERVDAALTLPATVVGVQGNLPAPQANKLIGWNEAANALQNFDPAILATIVAFGTSRADLFVGNGSTTQFALTANPGALANLDVSIGGVTQTPGVDYTFSGTTLTFISGAPANGVSILARYFQALPQGTTDSAASTFVPAGSGAVTRDVQSKLRDFVSSPIDFGAVGNGIVDCAAILSLGTYTGGAFQLPAGTYRVASSISISANVVMNPGAVIVPAAGVTVTFNGSFSAGPWQCFNTAAAGSAIVFNPARTVEGYAEWWGAVVNAPGSAAANVTAINAATAALRKTQLLAGIYWTNARIYIGQGYRELAGVGEHYDGLSNLQATRILCTSATENVLVIGPDVYPGSVNAMPEGIFVHDLLLDRSVAPNVTSDCTGLRVQYLLRGMLARVRTEQSIYGFRYVGTVYLRVDDCDAFRSVAGTGGADKFYGHYVDGGASIGLNGGNASIYLDRCVATLGGISITDSAGFYCDQKFTDTFIFDAETAGTAVGINVQGNGLGTLNYQNTNLQIRSPVVDAFTFAGIYINNVGRFGSVEILGGYAGPAAGASAAVWVNNSLGSVSMIGGQLVMGSASACTPVRVTSSAGVRVDGTQVLEAGSSAVAMDNATNCVIRPTLKNHSVVCPAAVQMFNTCTANRIEPVVMGAATRFSLGVQVVGTGDGRNEYALTGLDSGCIAGGSANKLVRNGVQITTTGLSGTNLVAGVMT